MLLTRETVSLKKGEQIRRTHPNPVLGSYITFSPTSLRHQEYVWRVHSATSDDEYLWTYITAIKKPPVEIHTRYFVIKDLVRYHEQHFRSQHHASLRCKA